MSSAANRCLCERGSRDVVTRQLFRGSCSDPMDGEVFCVVRRGSHWFTATQAKFNLCVQIEKEFCSVIYCVRNGAVRLGLLKRIFICGNDTHIHTIPLL